MKLAVYSIHSKDLQKSEFKEVLKTFKRFESFECLNIANMRNIKEMHQSQIFKMSESFAKVTNIQKYSNIPCNNVVAPFGFLRVNKFKFDIFIFIFNLGLWPIDVKRHKYSNTA